jgi:hypothetical protein
MLLQSTGAAAFLFRLSFHCLAEAHGADDCVLADLSFINLLTIYVDDCWVVQGVLQATVYTWLVGVTMQRRSAMQMRGRPHVTRVDASCYSEHKHEEEARAGGGGPQSRYSLFKSCQKALRFVTCHI